jgi:glycosyltransferase involved in cell wall biosynthesis
LPVVSTTVGAEGTESISGENVLLADDSQAFAQAVVEVLQNPELARRLSINGRATVKEKYDWRKVYSAWDDVYTH